MTTPPQVEYRTIELTQGQVAYVSPDRYEELSKFKWYAAFDKTINGFYALRTILKADGKPTKISMHRHIIGLWLGDKRTGDHRNHETLDNTNEKLRVLTVMEQSYNRRRRKSNTSGYKGVHWDARRKLWRASIRANGKRYNLGWRQTAKDAYFDLYLPASTKYQGQFACVGNEATNQDEPVRFDVSRPLWLLPDGDMYYIPLTQGQFAKVDKEDFFRYKDFKWTARWSEETKSYYATRGEKGADGKRFTILLHREVLGLVKGDGRVGDHINHETLDNRRSNLRDIEFADNVRHSRISKNNKSGLKGVHFCAKTGKWIAQIWAEGKKRGLGYYDTKLEAHRVYVEAANKYFGKFACQG